MLGLSTVAAPAYWVGFIVFVLVMLVLDLGVFHRESSEVSCKEALSWSIVWVLLSLAFNGFVYSQFGRDAAVEFLSAYLVEKSLSVDNLFVFIVIFRYMDVRPNVMHRVLFAGILGALVLRGIFIIVGIQLIEMFSWWMLYLFGLFLLWTGVRLLFSDEEAIDPSDNAAYRLARRLLPLTRHYHEQKFWIRAKTGLRFTPLFIVLLMIETSDVVFALDSIPAVFGITRDPFIAFTSNVCAVLGLRAMFFLLQRVLDRFAYLKYGLGLVLSYIGVKMILAEGIGVINPIEVPVGISLAIVAGLISASMAISLLMPPSVDHDEVLEQTQPASLIANVDPHAAISISGETSVIPPDESGRVLTRQTGSPSSADASAHANPGRPY